MFKRLYFIVCLLMISFVTLNAQTSNQLIRKGNKRRIALKTGARMLDALSNAGINAKRRYNTAPVAIDTGKVQSFKN